MLSKSVSLAIAAFLLIALPGAAQLPQTVQARFTADISFLERVRSQSTGPGAMAMQDSVRVRLPALDSTFDMLIAAGDADAAVRFASMMNAHWVRLGDYSRALSQFQRAFAVAGPASKARNAALNSAAMLAFRRRDQDVAGSLYKDALHSAEQIGDSAAISGAHVGLGRVAARNGNYAETQRQAEGAIKIREAMGDPRGKIGPYHLLAFANRLQKKYEAAARLYEYTIALHGLTQNPGGVASEMFNLGFTRLHQNDTVTAERLLRESLTAMKAINSPDQLYLLGAFAALAAVKKEPLRAAKLWGAMDAALDRGKLTLDPDDQVEIDTYVPVARRLGKTTAFDAARTEGRQLSLTEAIAFALERE